jgi:hypothetical protein
MGAADTTYAMSPLPPWIRLAGETYLHAPTRELVIVLDRVFRHREGAPPRYIVRALSCSAAPFVARADDLHSSHGSEGPDV